jgi:phage repressor protein C with HTH and peptisase S24 domain
MSPAYEHGDQLCVDPSKTIRPGDDCLFVRELHDGTMLALAKHLVRPTARKWRVKQFNPGKDFDLNRRVWRKARFVAGKMNRG